MKGSKTILAVVLGTLLITGIACGGKSASPTPTTTPTPTANEVNIDASYNGSEIILAVNNHLIVTLDSNATTGYSWNLSEISNTNVIQKVSDEYIAPEQTDPPMIGQGGQEVWTFEALAAGTATISMTYKQPWVPDAASSTIFKTTIIVE